MRSREPDGGAHALAQAVLLLVDALQAAAHAAMQHAGGALDALLAQTPLQHGQAVAQRLRRLGARGGDAVQQILARGHHQLGRGRGRGRAQIGDEIGDGDVGLVAHRRNHRHGAGRNGPRHGFFVEGPQVFERAAAAPHDDHVRPTRSRLKYSMPRHTSSTEPSPCTSAG